LYYIYKKGRLTATAALAGATIEQQQTTAMSRYAAPSRFRIDVDQAELLVDVQRRGRQRVVQGLLADSQLNRVGLHRHLQRAPECASVVALLPASAA
jgi:hypothetical protein